MQISNVAIYGIFPAIVGVRNSYKSVDKSDSAKLETVETFWDNKLVDWVSYNHAEIGENDMKLLKALSKRNDEYGEAERKFLRQIFVGMDIVGSLKFWAQMDTYKIGTVRNSQSTMHNILDKELTQNDFEISINNEHLEWINCQIRYYKEIKKLDITKFKSGDTKEQALIDMYNSIDSNLPAGYLLKSYWTGNYEVLRKIYRQRKKHKMYWWKQFCEVIETLPYAKEFIIGE